MGCRLIPINGGYELGLGIGDKPDFNINYLPSIMNNGSEIFFKHLKDIGVVFKDGKPHSLKIHNSS